MSSKTKVVRPVRARLKRVALVLLATPGILLLIATFTPLDVWWTELLRGDKYADKGDDLIVLSGSAGEEGAMGWSSYLRTTYASVAFRILGKSAKARYDAPRTGDIRDSLADISLASNILGYKPSVTFESEGRCLRRVLSFGWFE